MNKIRCMKGHFYDADQFASCPYCAAAQNGTSGPSIYDDPFDKTTKRDKSMNIGPDFGGNDRHDDYNATQPKQKSAASGGDASDLDQTRSVYQTRVETGKPMSKIVRPVVGWLVCIHGKDIGMDYRLVAGHNFVGRSDEMNVAIKNDDSISRVKHCVVTYEPVQSRFFVSPGESHELSYLNDEPVLGSRELKANDILTIGRSKLIFIPCCTEAFHWELAKEEK